MRRVENDNRPVDVDGAIREIARLVANDEVERCIVDSNNNEQMRNALSRLVSIHWTWRVGQPPPVTLSVERIDSLELRLDRSITIQRYGDMVVGFAIGGGGGGGGGGGRMEDDDGEEVTLQVIVGGAFGAANGSSLLSTTALPSR